MSGETRRQRPFRLGRWAWLVGALLLAVFASAGALPLPPRPTDAPTGSQLIERIAPLPLAEREARLETEVLRGNVPEFLRRLQPVTLRDPRGVRTNLVVIHVTPDYLAVGSDADYFLAPLTPATAQRIADASGCVLPTARLVDAIHAASPLKLQPAPIPPGPAMTSVAVFAQHNAMVRTQRLAQAAEAFRLGTLVAGHKKDVVLTRRLAEAPGKVAIYGWHKPDGAIIQPLYTGHADSWVDYSHGVRLISSTVEADGSPMTFAAALADPRFAPLLTDESAGPLPRYVTRTNSGRDALPRVPSRPGEDAPQRVPTGRGKIFSERIEELRPAPGVRVVVNSPPAEEYVAGKPLKLILYALPNGNTTEQTAGRRPHSTNEWRYDIQHIAAQTRWLRATDTNHLWVVAYLEADTLSWPSWRRKQTNDAAVIHGIVEALTRRFTNHPVRLVLTGHSGGGSFTFGFLDGLERIPRNERPRVEPLNRSSRREEALTSFPRKRVSLLTSAATRFMESLLDSKIAHRGHEPGRDALPRVQADQQVGPTRFMERIPETVERIAFLDSNYAYDPARGHADKLARWLKASDRHFLTVFAYDDANALLDGKPFVSATGGAWYRSHLMQTNLAAHFAFTRADPGGFQNAFALERRVQFLLKENPARKVLHTVQVERNGFLHAMLAGTPLEGRGYEYFGPRAYEVWIEE